MLLDHNYIFHHSRRQYLIIVAAVTYILLISSHQQHHDDSTTAILLLSTTYAMSSPSSSLMKRILVTGGNKGIGKAICERLLTEWSDTYVILGSRDMQRGEEAVKDLIQSIGGNTNDRIEACLLDTSTDESVREAAISFQTKHGTTAGSLYGIINNAGIGFGFKIEENINTNYFGPRRVNDAFSKFLQRPGGRIVNVGSASGSNYVRDLPATSASKSLLAKPWTIPGGIADIDEIARNPTTMLPAGGDPYGASKALLHAYTIVHAKIEKDLIINVVTPGFIATDLTSGFGASNPPSKGAIPPCYLMMDDKVIPNVPTGRYYGSDSIRSPIDVYRGPGDAPYENDDDLVDLPPTARTIVSIFNVQ